jgi:hypothetical protein
MVDSIARRDHSKPLVLDTTKRGQCGRKSRFNFEVKEHLKSFNRITSHYSNTAQQGQTKFFFDQSLCPAKLWMSWCETFDTKFANQAHKYKYWTSYDRRAPPKLQDGDEWINPSMPHSTYSYKLGKYDLRFGHKKVDLCNTCESMRAAIAATVDAQSQAEQQRVLMEHKKMGDSYYAARRDDDERTEREFQGWEFDSEADFCSVVFMETQCQDAAGNLRTPRLQVGEAYYKRILPTWCYGIHSRAANRSTMLFWNEVIGKKGANDVISAEHWHHMNRGTGAKMLQLWFDKCGGQVCNWDGALYHCHISDPDSALYMYGRIDEKMCLPGHSYSVCDREFGVPQRAAKHLNTIETMDDWIQIYSDCNRAHPFVVHKMEQDEFRDWSAYLRQFYVTGRKSSDGEKAAFQSSQWRNYGYGPEMCEDNIIRSVIICLTLSC